MDNIEKFLMKHQWVAIAIFLFLLSSMTKLNAYVMKLIQNA